MDFNSRLNFCAFYCSSVVISFFAQVHWEMNCAVIKLSMTSEGHIFIVNNHSFNILENDIIIN